MLKKFKRYRLLLFALLCILLPEMLLRFGSFGVSDRGVEQKVMRYLDQRIQVARERVKALTDNHENILQEDQRDIFFVVYQNAEPIAWSSDKIPQIETVTQFENEKELSGGFYGNGYYVRVANSKGAKTVVAWIRIYANYKFTNSFLQDEFAANLKIPKGYKIRELANNKSKADVLISVEKIPLFYLHKENNENSTIPWFMVFLQLLGVLLLLHAIVNLTFVFAHRHPYAVSMVVVAVALAVKLLISVAGIVSVLKQSDIFNPEVFASGTFNPSLGDFLVSFAVLFVICFYFYRAYFLFLQGNKNRFFFYVIFTSVILVSCQFMLLDGLQNLVVNSKIDFFFKNINSLNNYTVLGVCALGFGLFGLMFLLSRIRLFYAQYPSVLKIILGIQCLFVVFAYLVFAGHFMAQTIVFAALMVVYIVWPEKRALSPFNSTAIVLVVFSIICSTIFYATTFDKEHNDRRLLAEKLSDNQDPDMEIEFGGLMEGLRNDTVLANTDPYKRTFSQNALEDYLDNKYFSNIIRDYEIKYTLFTEDTALHYKYNVLKSELRKTLRIISYSGKKTASKNLYYIYNRQGGVDYVADLEIVNPQTHKQLIVQFFSKRIPVQNGLHELLGNNNQFYAKLISDYSFVRFINNNLVEQKGGFLYSANPNTYKGYNQKTNLFTNDGYEHLLYRTGAESFVVISKPVTSYLTHITSFSYILILFGLQFGLISIVLYSRKAGVGVFNLSAKIQTAFIVLTILAMTLFGLTIQYTISNQYTTKNHNLVADKLFSLHTELQGKTGYKNSLSDDPDLKLQAILAKFSKIFFTDINFYNTKGLLVASSVPKLYRFNIQSRLMNPVAFKELNKREKPMFIHEEQIAKMKFISGYLPLFNDQKKILGYIHVPFFSRQNSVSNEFTSLLMVIINIFVVLFALTILISVIVTQVIVSPLTKIRESIAKIQLNKINKPILYKGKDELADLVKEYNNKVAELEKYAFYLAQNERETAWREMAKQVAHEIKNPLTPMKLNIQHMQRSLKPDDPDFDQKLKRISHSLIEQIDTLTNIASEFSSLAKMPGSKFEQLDLIQLIESVIEFYTDDDAIEISFENRVGATAYINGDKEQLLRVLNNLVKNAQQAIPEHTNGKITLKLEKQAHKFMTYVIDNGQGISPEQKEKIFQPNFTTKSTGSGLGLAMVKNIVEQHGGEVYFETAQGQGTTFVFELNAV